MQIFFSFLRSLPLASSEERFDICIASRKQLYALPLKESARNNNRQTNSNSNRAFHFRAISSCVYVQRGQLFDAAKR